MLDKFITLEDLKGKLKEGRSPASFIPGETRPIINKDSILIDPIDFLEGANADIDESCFHHIEAKDELTNMMDNFEYDFGDNSCNHGGYLQREIGVKLFKNDDTGERLAAFSVHIGLDVRAGYSGQVWILFEDDYCFYAFLDQRFSVTACVDDHIFYVDLSGFNEFVNVYYDNPDTGAYLSDDTCDFWACDSDELVDNIKEMLEDSDIPYNSITV